jgi:hypothetical protein
MKKAVIKKIIVRVRFSSGKQGNKDGYMRTALKCSIGWHIHQTSTLSKIYGNGSNISYIKYGIVLKIKKTWNFGL